MLSRVAESLYWLSRYLERADNVARFIDVNAHLTLDRGTDSDTAQWEPLVTTTADEALFNELYGEATEKNVIRFLTFEPDNPNSILSCIRAARENARTVREVIPSELWEVLNELYHLVGQHSRKHRMESLRDFFRTIRRTNHQLIGLFEAGMSHHEGWHFARMGRMLERADKTARILDVKYFLLLPGADYVDSPYDAVEWGAVLKSADAFEMYRQQHHRVNYRDAVEFLIFSPCFPRSMAYSVGAASRSLGVISGLLGVETSANAEMLKLKEGLAEASIASVFERGLHEFIDHFQIRLNEADSAIFQSFFALR